jgi:hypothetical protein
VGIGARADDRDAAARASLPGALEKNLGFLLSAAPRHLPPGIVSIAANLSATERKGFTRCATQVNTGDRPLEDPPSPRRICEWRRRIFTESRISHSKLIRSRSLWWAVAIQARVKLHSVAELILA